MSYTFLKPGSARYSGLSDQVVDFTLDHQLMNAQTWKNFVEVFRSDCDDDDMGWRCEYWGKMMRGAVLTYLYRGDDQLYAVLEETVRDLLTTQRPDGRFSTYSQEKQLTGGWDMWGRKYILTGSLHFYRICKDNELKAQILSAMKQHADAILALVGPEEGKRSIFDTSTMWGGVNSCSVLEPMVDLYKTCGERKYLEFAEYIIDCGGCVDGNLLELAREGKIMPYMYPEVKAYETMSFFEGVLAYYELTGKQEYLEIVLKFMEDVYATDISAIGCSGCTHELFDHSRIRQILYSDVVMQETCVTVTWMRLNARLYLLTGEHRFVDRLEISGWNALYGSVNTNMLVQYYPNDGKYLSPLPFDSYSPLFNNRRGMGIGGLKKFAFGGFYGCCACIASAGTALMPLCANVSGIDGIALNIYLPGSFCAKVGEQDVQIDVASDYPKKAEVAYTFRPASPAWFAVRLRVPDFCENAIITLDGEAVDAPVQDGYVMIERAWSDGDVLKLSAQMPLRVEKVSCDDQERTAFFVGPLTLARDAAKETETIDLTEMVVFPAGPLQWTYVQEDEHELVRLQIHREDTLEDLLLTDYQSCGKGWLGNPNRISVWLNTNI